MIAMTNTETVSTKYGEVEVEVVTCDSCGQEIKESEALRFTVEDDAGSGHYSHTINEGSICKHCANNPIDYPRTKTVGGHLRNMMEILSDSTGNFRFSVVAYLIVTTAIYGLLILGTILQLIF